MADTTINANKIILLLFKVHQTAAADKKHMFKESMFHAKKKIGKLNENLAVKTGRGGERMSMKKAHKRTAFAGQDSDEGPRICVASIQFL